MSFYIYKGDRPSDGAKNLKDAIDGTILRAEGSAFRGRRGSRLIVWGNTSQEARRLYDLAPLAFNNPRHISIASNKASFFATMVADAPGLAVPHVNTFDDALALVDEGSRVFARTVLNGHSGEGIHLMLNPRDSDIAAVRQIRNNNLLPVWLSQNEQIPQALRDCRLFTQGISGKRTEFRVHVFQGRAILTQVKLRREGAQELPAYNSLVRNVASGWVYGVNNVPEAGRAEAEAAAIRAMGVVNLDFGAVDIVYKADGNKAFVLEINTAPGLADDGSALKAYADAFKEVQ